MLTLFVNELAGRTNYPQGLRNHLIPCYPIVSDVDLFCSFETFATRVSGRLLFKMVFRTLIHSRPLRNFSFVALRQSVMQVRSSKAERFNCRDESGKINIYEIYLKSG